MCFAASCIRLVAQATLLLLLLAAAAEAFYLPGVAPREYADGDKVEIKVHKLSSPKTQLPYDYYSLPFCKPEEISRQAENLGEVMSGAIIQNSPYELYMGKVGAALPTQPFSRCTSHRVTLCAV